MQLSSISVTNRQILFSYSSSGITCRQQHADPTYRERHDTKFYHPASSRKNIRTSFHNGSRFVQLKSSKAVTFGLLWYSANCFILHRTYLHFHGNNNGHRVALFHRVASLDHHLVNDTGHRSDGAATSQTFLTRASCFFDKPGSGQRDLIGTILTKPEYYRIVRNVW
jgi:hypothetical protein